MKKKKNGNLQQAKNARKDEFYTQATDIEEELKHYRNYFKDKVVYCNCDHPSYSEFWRYFHVNFHFLGMKELISTHYNRKHSTYALIYRGGVNEQSDNDYNNYDKKILLKENGDFRSKESIELLKKSDVIVTNPPFSLFKEFVAQLFKYKKQFIIWGNLNAVTYKEVFPLLQEQKMWIGFTANKTCVFRLDNSYQKWDKTITAEHNDGYKYGKVPSITVYTNIPIKKTSDKIILWKHFKQADFPVYDNYAAFECKKVANIPVEQEIDVELNNDRLEEFKKTYGQGIRIIQKGLHSSKCHIKRPIFGVPITFLCKYNPNTTNPASNIRKSSINSYQVIGNEDTLNIPRGRSYINGKRQYSRIFIKFK